jgi:dTDP-4-dehydrorhamnose 3,5-epimerase
LLIDIEPIKDQRGFFARTWCRQELAARGFDTETAQESASYSAEQYAAFIFQRPPFRAPFARAAMRL